jgi:O-antigen/teichoic acid export membrane protein
MISIVVIGFSLFLLLAFLFRHQIYDYYSDKPPEYLDYLPYAIPLVLLLALINVFKHYTSNFQRVVVPYIVNDLFLKIAFPTLILLFVGQIIGLDGLVWGLLLTYVVILLMMVAYLGRLGELTFRLPSGFLSKERMKRMGTYAIYGILGSLGGILAFQIDVFMVANLLTLYAASVYSISLFIANTIDVPLRAVFGITSPIVSKAWKEDNLEEINHLYKRSSINLFLFGSFLFLIIWLNLDDLYALLPEGNKLIDGKYVILFLGLAKLVDQLTSINGAIINYSRYFRFNFFAVMVLSVLNITLNILLIPRFQVVGAALATMTSLILFNLLKVLFIYFRMGFHPFSRKTIWVALVGLACYGLIVLLPLTPFLLLNMIIRSVLITAFFGVLTLYLNLSPDISNLVKEGWQKIKTIIRR